MPDQSHVGRHYGPFTYTVEGADVVRYAQAVMAQGPAVPLMFAAVYCLRPVMGALFSDSNVGIPLDGVIHSEQSLAWGVPVNIGDRIDAEGAIASVQERRGLVLLSLDTRATNQDGAEVCSGRTVLIQRASV